MKEQQALQSEHEQQLQNSRESAYSLPERAAFPVSVQQWAALLEHAQDTLRELPPCLLEQLAPTLGNSTLIALLRQDRGDGPETCHPPVLTSQREPPEINSIQTFPPILVPIEGWPQSDGRPQPVRPGRLCLRS